MRVFLGVAVMLSGVGFAHMAYGPRGTLVAVAACLIACGVRILFEPERL